MRYRRRFVPGGTYFITMALADRSSRLLTENIPRLKNAFISVRNTHPFIINAIVILPDHLHMIITLPEDDVRYSMRLGMIKNIFSRSLDKRESISMSRIRKRERGIWQRRFWEHCIRDERDYITHVNYIHYNPVKHKYVKSPIDWKYSSIHKYVRLGKLSPNWSAYLGQG